MGAYLLLKSTEIPFTVNRLRMRIVASRHSTTRGRKSNELLPRNAKHRGKLRIVPTAYLLLSTAWRGAVEHVLSILDSSLRCPKRPEEMFCAARCQRIEQGRRNLDAVRLPTAWASLHRPVLCQEQRERLRRAGLPVGKTSLDPATTSRSAPPDTPPAVAWQARCAV